VVDRVIAFFAGAILAFGLGYLVGFQVNNSDSTEDVSRARQELEESGDDGRGLVDAKVPKLKSLVDLANQGEDAITTDLSKDEIKELKNMLLPHLTPADVAGWHAARETYIAKFLTISTEGPWAVGSDEGAGKRFDAKIAVDAEGHYQGKM